MNTNRRHFIKTAGAGAVGLALAGSAFGEVGAGGNGADGAAADGLFQQWGVGGGTYFPRATPESQGVSSQAISQFITAANASGISWHSFMLLRHGRVVAEGWWKPYSPGFVHSLYSLSKSFTSTAIGLLVKEGKLDIQAKVISFFPNDLPATLSENAKAMTVRSLLTMNTGHGEDTMPKMRASQDSWVRTYLAQPVEYAPGSHFLYNTGNTYMLGAILHTITGETLESYLAPRLFKPLEITGYDWETSPQGLNTAGYGLRVHTEDIAKLGQLYLQKGKWKEQSILPQKWVEEATSAQTTSQVNNGDWSQGYGYQFWRCTHNFYRGDGAYGQFCIVMPELDAVLAVTGQSQDMQKSMNIIWDNIVPGIQTGALPENRAGQQGLKAALAGLVLPVTKGVGSSPLSSKYNNKSWVPDVNDLDVGGLKLSFSDKSCVLMVEKGKEKVFLDFGWESWMLNTDRDAYAFNQPNFVPMPSRIAGTAAWIDEHTLQLKVRFVEAIFGDTLTCVFAEDRLTISFLNSIAETAVKKTPDPRKPVSWKML